MRHALNQVVFGCNFQKHLSLPSHETDLYHTRCFAYGQTYSKGDRQGYFDSNFGVAWLGYDYHTLFPGCSFLGGVRTFRDERHFIEMEAGVAIKPK